MPAPPFPANHCRTIASRGSVRSDGLVCAYCQGHLVADLYIDRVDSGGYV